MKGLPAELIYILLIGGVLLFNYFTQQAARRRQAEMEQDEAPQEAPPQEDALDEDIWGRAPRIATALPERAAYVEPAGRSKSPSASPAPARRRFSRQSLMGTRRDVQNAVVIAAILGPCRAFEPHDKQ
jgi:hypothetical protein